jgi:hypothetical protein
MPAQETEVDGVAIRPRASNAADTDAPVCSADVFDNDRLSERHSHSLCKDSPDHVRIAAGRERNNHRDGTRRIGLRCCNLRERKSDCNGCGEL